ncbi:zinc finger protein 675-like [Sabethes cyaneus]|uniref:zinc finger protein 675-like n=1 Tax=Sabethes cyaneus TaxID=53552 RepID=UPI00237D569F|nr:zinc finger protein 675-like [Sabethes cyaneus]
MDSSILLVPNVNSLPAVDNMVNETTEEKNSLARTQKKCNEYRNENIGRRGDGSNSGTGSKHKHKTDGELILVMEPQNPSPTKYFDQNGIPLKKEFLDSELNEIIGKGTKKRTKLTITCHKCCERFESKVEYEFHYRKSYNQEPVYACATCDKRISQYKAYRLHIYRHSNSANQRYTCGTCSKVFHQKSDLNRHESVHGNPSALPQEPEVVTAPTQPIKASCDRCDAVFESQAEVKIHAKKIHPIPKQMIECPDCGKFLSAGSLYSHRKIHSDGPKFTCEDCDKSFVQKINFIHHRKKHLPNDERPFPCGECGKAFFERSHLQRHQFFHSEERPFKCGLCGKCYKTERCLKVHSAVHNADRPFVCNECNKGFLSSSKLRQHSNIHSGLRPFKCKYCSRDFTNFPNWLKHIRRRHKVDHRTGEKLDSVPKFMTKKKEKPAHKKIDVREKQSKACQTKKKQLKEVLQLAIKEESLPFVGENSNIDLNLVSKDDLLQPLKMEEMDDMFPQLSNAVAEDENAETNNVNTTIQHAKHEDGEHASEPLRPPATEHNDMLDPPPLGLAADDSELFQFGYVQPEFDCDFTIKNDFTLRTEAVNVIRESESGVISPPENDLSPHGTGLVYDINSELPIFPTLISICGEEQQFQLINPNFIHLPQLRKAASGSGTDVVTLKIETP